MNFAPKSYKETGLADPGIIKEINILRTKILKEENTLKAKENNVDRQKKFRAAQKLKMDKLAEILGVSDIFRPHKTVGRPRLEENQPELLKTILEIATFAGAADPKRRTEIIHCVRTLNDLHDKLLELGLNISRIAKPLTCDYCQETVAASKVKCML